MLLTGKFEQFFQIDLERVKIGESFDDDDDDDELFLRCG